MEKNKFAIEEFSNMGFGDMDDSSPLELQIELGVKDIVFEKNNKIYFSRTITCSRNEEKILDCLKANGILLDMFKISPSYKGTVFDSTAYTIDSIDELSSWVMKQILFGLVKSHTEELYFIIKEKDGGPDAIIKRTFVVKTES